MNVLNVIYTELLRDSSDFISAANRSLQKKVDGNRVI